MAVHTGRGVIVTVIGVVSIQFMVTIIASGSGVDKGDRRLEEMGLIECLLVCNLIGILLVSLLCCRSREKRGGEWR